MPAAPRRIVEEAAANLLRALADADGPPKVRHTAAAGPVMCMILVWDARTAPMPTASAAKRKTGERTDCKRDVLAAVEAAGKPLTRLLVVKALRAAKVRHGPGTVAKALAELTATGELVNPRDRRGYRLPEWPRRTKTPGLFD